MLPAHARLRRREDFTRVLRAGNRAGRTTVVVHASLGAASTAVDEPARVGFIVSKAVGNAVMRHRVTRQLRHLVAERLTALPAGSAVVVRALPAAAGQPSDTLARDLDAALRRVRSPGGRAKR